MKSSLSPSGTPLLLRLDCLKLDLTNLTALLSKSLFFLNWRLGASLVALTEVSFRSRFPQLSKAPEPVGPFLYLQARAISYS